MPGLVAGMIEYANQYSRPVPESYEESPALAAALTQHQAAGTPPPDDLSDLIASTLHAAINPENLAISVGKASARHIVTGLLEPPQPVPLSFGGVIQMELADEPMVVALASAATDLDALTSDFRLTWREAFHRGPRNRGPDLNEQTRWLSACERLLRKAEPPPDSIDLELAKIAFQLWPEVYRSQLPPDSYQYQADLLRAADNIRRNLSNYRQWLAS